MTLASVAAAFLESQVPIRLLTYDGCLRLPAEGDGPAAEAAIVRMAVDPQVSHFAVFPLRGASVTGVSRVLERTHTKR